MITITVFALALAANSQPAFAQSDDDIAKEVEKIAAQARESYNLQDYKRAIASYLTAYQLADTGALLYNVAYIYDHNLDEIDLAIEFYRRYIRSNDAEPAVIQRATGRIQFLKAAKKRGDDRSSGMVAPLGTNPSPGPGAVIPKPENGAPPTSNSRSTWGWSLIGTGGAFLATGVAVGIVASGTHSDFSAESEPAKKKSLQDKGKSQTLVADLLMGAGIVAATTGVILLLTGGDRSAAGENPSLQWGVAANPAGGMFVLGGRF